MMKLCLPAFLCLYLSGIAQTVNYDSIYPTYAAQLNHIFEYVNLQDVPNGVLKEHGYPFVEPKEFGTSLTTSNLTDPDQFGFLYASIYSMAVDDQYRLPNPKVYMERISKQTEKSPIELLGLFQNYYTIDEDAVDNGLLQKVEGQLFDVEGRSESPYAKNTTFLMATTKQWLHTNTLQFAFNPSTFFNNTGLTIVKLSVDYDDGNGFQDCSSFKFPPVKYATAGMKHIQFTIVDSNGDEWKSHTNVNMDFEKGLAIPYGEPDTSFTIASSEIFQGVGGYGTVNISYACGHNSLQKPFIWVEGWNPYSISEKLDMSLTYNDAVQRINVTPAPDDIRPISQYLIDEGYDFVMIDFGSSDLYLESNALFIEESIRHINDLKHANGSNEKNVAMGQSMGGMTLRYALRDMETKNQDHETGTYISFDAAQMGVNLPLGGQYGIKHVAEITVGEVTGVQLADFVVFFHEALRILDIPSSREMILYNAPEHWNGQFWQNDPDKASLHDDYYYRQNEYFGMPKKCERIAIVNGSVNGVAGKHGFEPGDEVLAITASTFITEPIASFLLADKYLAAFTSYSITLPMVLNATGANVDFHIHALQDNATDQEIYRGSAAVFVFGIPAVLTACRKKVSNRQAVDGPEGGYIGRKPIRVPQDALDAIGATFKLNTFCFTPTSSTLYDFHSTPTHRRRPAQLSNTYTDQYSYIHTFLDTNFQAFVGVMNPILDTLNVYYQNSGHTWFNYQNAPAMLRYVTGNNQIDGLTSLNTTYNFGKLPLGSALAQLNPPIVRTGGTIHHSMYLDNGGILRVNSSGYIGYLQNSGSIVSDPHGYFRVDLLKACEGDNVVVSAFSGSFIEVGDIGGRTGDLVINDGTTLDIFGSSKLTINAGSRVVVDKGGTLRIRSGAEAVIQNEGTILVRPGGTLIYDQDAKITTVDQNSRLRIEGTLSLGSNAAFKINRSGSNQSGLVIFTGSPKITAQSGASVLFDAAADYDPIVQVDSNTYVAFDDPDITQVKFTTCAVVMDKLAHMMVGRYLTVDHANFHGRDRHDARLSFRARNNFYASTFTDLILQADMYFPTGDLVHISNCTFNTQRTSLQGGTTYHVKVTGKGYDIHDCTFTNLISEASVYSEDLTLVSGIANCTFSATSGMGATAAMEDHSNIEISFYHNTLSNLREGLIKSTGLLTMECNTMSNFSYRYVTASNGAKVNLATQSGGGYNQFGVCTDLNYWSHIWLDNADIDISAGANTFALNNYHQYFVRGSIPQSCSSPTSCTRNFNQNNFNSGASASSTKFNIVSSNGVPVTCSSANIYFNPACGSMNGGGTDPVDPQNPGVGQRAAVSTYYSDIEEEPVLLDDGVKAAKDETTEIDETSGNNVSAIDRFDEIFTAPIPTDGDNRRFMLNAQDVMKSTVENLVLDSVVDITANTGTFTPEFDSYVNSLNRLSDSIIDTTNYREQFYLEMKKVTLFRLLDKPDMALELIQNIEACGVDSTEQALLNREKMYAQRVIAAAQYDPETDSTFDFSPSGLLKPEANLKPQYYFGSTILSPSSITYMVCQDSGDMKSMRVDSKETDGVTMNLYPNPAGEELNYQITDKFYGDGQIKVIQPDGRTILELSMQTGVENRINVSQWASGVYQLLYFRANGTIIQQRFVVK